MLQNTKPIAVFGATGAQGAPVAHALLDANQPVHAIARSKAHLQPLAARGARIFATDLTDTEGLKRALDGVAGAFVHLPLLPMLDLIEAQARSIVNALTATAVPLVVFTSGTAVPTAFTGNGFLDAKLVADPILRSMDIPLIRFQPMLYLENNSTPLTAAGVAAANQLHYPLPAEQALPWISVQDQARLTLAALARPDLAGRSFRIGERLTGYELAEAISVGLGRTIQYVPMDPEAFSAAIAPFLGEQLAAGLAHFYHLLGSNHASLSLETETDTAWQELGVAATPVSTWAHKQPWEAVAAGR